MLTDMTINELVDLYNTLSDEPIAGWKGKKTELIELLSTPNVTVKSIASMIGANPYNVRERLREARAEGLIDSPHNKRYLLSVADVATVFHMM